MSDKERIAIMKEVKEDVRNLLNDIIFGELMDFAENYEKAKKIAREMIKECLVA